MGDNNENPTVQEIPADKCVQRTMAVGSPRPAVKEHSPNMGTKTTLSSFLFNMSRRCLSERTFPKHGDENQLCLALTFNVFPGERTFPKHGDENFVLSSTLSSFLIVSERTFPKHGDENK